MIVNRWYRDCITEEQKAERKSQLMLCKHLFDVLGEILQEEYDSAVKEMQDKDNYFMPAWSEYQASRLGKQEAYKKVMSILP